MLKKTISYLATFLELQLIISLISLPVLIHWGLAVSYMTPIANLIFTPLLTAFLCCASLYTLCILLHVPTILCTWSLETLSKIWFWLLSFARPSWLIGFSYIMLIPAIGIAVYVIYFYTRHRPNTKKGLLVLTTSCFLLFFSNRLMHTSKLYQVDDLPLFIGTIHNKTYMFDNGALCCKRNFYQWIDYTILPSIIKKTGITTIDTLVLYKPSKNIMQTIKQFAIQTHITTICATTKNRCFQQLQETFKNSPITVLPIKKGVRQKTHTLLV